MEGRKTGFSPQEVLQILRQCLGTGEHPWCSCRSGNERDPYQRYEVLGLSRAGVTPFPTGSMNSTGFACFVSDPVLKPRISVSAQHSTLQQVRVPEHGSTQNETFPAGMRWEQGVEAQADPVTVCRAIPHDSQPPIKIIWDKVSPVSGFITLSAITMTTDHLHHLTPSPFRCLTSLMDPQDSCPQAMIHPVLPLMIFTQR